MTTDLSSKLKQVIEQIPKEMLYDFVCSYAHSHESWQWPLSGEYKKLLVGKLHHPTAGN